MVGGSRLGVAALAALLLLAAASASSQAAALPGNRFPVTDRAFHLSGETGTVQGLPNVLLLREAAPAAQSSQFYLAPGMDVLGLIVTPPAFTWYAQVLWDKDLEVVDDSVAVLYFVANAQGVNGFSTVNLYDVAPDGQADLVDSDQRQFVTALSPMPVEFPLRTAGTVVEQGHVLALEVLVQTGNAAVVLQHGGETPSALVGLKTRWLDTDGDGMPDSDEEALGHNPLDPSDADTSGVDSDDDGIPDAVEEGIGTDPADADTDNDGYGDGLEVHAGSDPLDPDSRPYDANQNGLPDSFETTYFSNTTFSNGTTVHPTPGPCTPGPNCVDPFADPDGDGCSNLCEAMHGTDPNDPDTDGDGNEDGEEVAQGTDPAAYTTFLGPRGIPEPVATAAAFAIGTSISLVALLRRP